MPKQPGRESEGVGRLERLTWPPSLPFPTVLARARVLDSTALGMIYMRFLPVIYRYVLARVADVPYAEDVTAETFFAMLESITTTRADDELSFAAWLLGIARNKVAMFFRRQRNQQEWYGALPEGAEPLAVADEDDPLGIITSRESWSEVVQALNQLTEDQRAVVLYRCVLGFSADEVAQLLKKQAGTIRALQFRALASLARHLSHMQPGSEPQESKRRPGYAPRR